MRANLCGGTFGMLFEDHPKGEGEQHSLNDLVFV